MFRIRKTKTASGASAVQVVSYRSGRTNVFKHIGSAHTEAEISALYDHARAYIERHAGQASLFPTQTSERTFSLAHTRLLRTTHLFARSFFHACARVCGLNRLDPVVIDLAMMRIIEPSSKLRALELIERFFAIRYNKRAYGILRSLLSEKAVIERAALTCARTVLKEDLFLILYDVTTLYFETFRADALRVHGFSKDDKSKQPQIVVGLLTTRSGYPLSHDVFPGKTFEGNTMLPVLETFSRNHGVKMPIVVADAAMLSQKNMEELKRRNLRYIVGGRLANTSPPFIRKVSKALGRRDDRVVRFSTGRHGDVVCSFSMERYRKDKREMEKQLERARRLIAKNETGQRAKFVMKVGGSSVALNDDLISKTKALLGIKGYCTNIPKKNLSSRGVIDCYHDLWNVEHSFRMSKHDLQARPVFHRTEDAIRAHLLLCFISLMMGRYLEIASGFSLRKVRDIVWNVEEAHIEDTVTRETFLLRTPLDELLNSPLGPLVTRWKCDTY